MIDPRTYGGGLGGPSIRGRDTGTLIGGREGLRAPRPAVKTAARPTTIIGSNPNAPKTPKPKVKVKKKPTASAIQKKLDKVWVNPALDVPTLAVPTLDMPTLAEAELEDFNVSPIEIGSVPVLEAAPEASPVVAMPDRQSAAMRAAKLKEIARIRGMQGYGSTMSQGARGDTSRVMTRRGV